MIIPAIFYSRQSILLLFTFALWMLFNFNTGILSSNEFTISVLKASMIPFPLIGTALTTTSSTSTVSEIRAYHLRRRLPYDHFFKNSSFVIYIFSRLVQTSSSCSDSSSSCSDSDSSSSSSFRLRLVVLFRLVVLVFFFSSWSESSLSFFSRHVQTRRSLLLFFILIWILSLSFFSSFYQIRRLFDINRIIFFRP
jgi:hypothetical protein